MGNRNGVSVTPKRNSKGEIVRGTWLIVVSFGKDAAGKRLRKKETFQGTKAAANSRGEAIKRELEGGLDPQADRITFRDFALDWLARQEKAGTVRSRTLSTYRTRINRLLPVFGAYPLKKITPRVIEDGLIQLRKTNLTQEGGELTGMTAHGLFQMLSQLLKAAERNDLVVRNQCERVDAPKKDTPEKRALSAEEVLRLSKCINESEEQAYSAIKAKEVRMHSAGKRFARGSVAGLKNLSCLTAIRLALATGMRISEVFGLTWEHVSLENKSIEVVQTCTSRGQLEEPKTEKSKRIVSFDKETALKLVRLKKIQSATLGTIGIVQLAHVPVCCSEVGRYITYANFHKWLSAWRDKNKLDFTPHLLRHTQATLLLDAGMSVKQVQSRLGHASANTTLDIYSHAVEGKDEEAASIVEGIMYPKTAYPVQECPQIVPIVHELGNLE